MVSVFGWPDPNTRESCESWEKRAKHEPKASDFARFSQLEQLYQVINELVIRIKYCQLLTLSAPCPLSRNSALAASSHCGIEFTDTMWCKVI